MYRTVLVVLAVPASVAIGQPVSAHFTTGSMGGGGFPAPANFTAQPTNTTGVNGGGSTGGGLASATVLISDTASNTTVRFFGSATHSSEFGLTFAGSYAQGDIFGNPPSNPFILQLNAPATFSITNTSTRQDRVTGVSSPFVPVTFQAITGQINGSTLSAGTYRLICRVDAGPNAANSNSAQADWRLILTGQPAVCDDIDFNNDGLFPDTADIDDFLSVFSGGPCSTGTCGDIDFNNDTLFPDTSDIDALLRVFSGGACA